MDDYGPAVQNAGSERRGVERRAMPPEVRTVYRELLQFSRANGAVSDGLEWVAVPKRLLQSATECLDKGWRRE